MYPGLAGFLSLRGASSSQRLGTVCGDWNPKFSFAKSESDIAGDPIRTNAFSALTRLPGLPGPDAVRYLRTSYPVTLPDRGDGRQHPISVGQGDNKDVQPIVYRVPS